MERRTFLTGVSAATTFLLAGCGGDGDTDLEENTPSETTTTDSTSPTPAAEDSDGSSPTESPMESSTETPTETAEPTASPTPETPIAIESSEFVSYEGAGSTSYAVRGTLVNQADRQLEYVEVAVQYLDADNNVIGEFFTNMVGLQAGQRWQFHVDYYSEADVDPENVESYDIRGDWTFGEVPDVAEGLSLDEVTLTEVEEFGETVPAVEGTVQNESGEMLDYVEAKVHFLNDSNTVIGTNFSNQSDLEDGHGWTFQVTYNSPADVPKEEVSDYNLYLTT